MSQFAARIFIPIRDSALFNLAIDSKLCSCDLVKLKVLGIAQSSHVLNRTMVLQQKIPRPVQFEITKRIREILSAGWNTQIYRRTKNIRAVQLLLGHSKLESSVRYLGVEVDNALELAEQTEGQYQ